MGEKSLEDCRTLHEIYIWGDLNFHQILSARHEKIIDRAHKTVII